MRPEPDLLTVVVVGEDPLVRSALTRALRSTGRVAVEAGVEGLVDADAVEDADAWVWDVGPQASEETLDPTAAPVLALVRDSAQARDALADGARGVLLRTDDGDRLGAAVCALDAGLIVIDESLSGDLLPDRMPSAVRRDSGRLTPREAEVLGLLAEGLSNPDLAKVMDVSVHTVKFHVNAILTKLGAATRTEAVVLAARMGLLRL